MSDDSLLTSRTAWTSILTVAATQLETFQKLPTTLQVGCIGVAIAYILGRSFQKGMQLLSQKKA